jgi:hypothetical protein
VGTALPKIMRLGNLQSTIDSSSINPALRQKKSPAEAGDQKLNQTVFGV